jgi:hypothetical protein
MQVQNIDTPNQALIKKALPRADYEDCFIATFFSSNAIGPERATKVCLTSLTGHWTDALFRLRNVLVKPFGLKTADENVPLQYDNITVVKGGKISFFDVLDINHNEVLLGIRDTHLDAYLSISIEQGIDQSILSMATRVKLHNRFGKYYLSVIKPFHVLIVKKVLRNASKKLTSK